MEEADKGVKLSAILFGIELGLPKKLDEQKFLIELDRKFNDSFVRNSTLLCELVDEAGKKLWSLIREANLLLVDNAGLFAVMVSYCNGLVLFKELEELPEIVDVSEKAKSLNFDVQSGENKCEIIMNTTSKIHKSFLQICEISQVLAKAC